MHLRVVSRCKDHETESIDMDQYQVLNHSKWECKYHVVFIPKCRRKILYAALRRDLGQVFRTLTDQKECRIEEGHLMPDHVHMMISIPPKSAVSQVVGYLKGKSAIHVAREHGGRRRNFVGQHFWARGYFVSSAGLNRWPSDRRAPPSRGRTYVTRWRPPRSHQRGRRSALHACSSTDA